MQGTSVQTFSSGSPLALETHVAPRFLELVTDSLLVSSCLEQFSNTTSGFSDEILVSCVTANLQL